MQFTVIVVVNFQLCLTPEAKYEIQNGDKITFADMNCIYNIPVKVSLFVYKNNCYKIMSLYGIWQVNDSLLLPQVYRCSKNVVLHNTVCTKKKTIFFLGLHYIFLNNRFEDAECHKGSIWYY